MDLIERAAQKQKKKKSSASLVERAAEKAGDDKKKLAIGGIGSPGGRADSSAGGQPEGLPEARPDPSSLNPAIAEEKPKTGGIGIGSPGKTGGQGRPKAKFAVGIGVPGASKGPADMSLEPTPVAPPAAEMPAPAPNAPVSSGLVGAPKKGPASKRKSQDIDLVALRESGYITPDMPPNLMSEEFRIIKRSILLNAFAKGDKKVKNGNVVLVTSSNPGEGKSFCAINLALSVATEQDTTVLLIDADFSKPEVLNRLGISGGRGLMDVVADENIEVGDCLIRTSIPNLVLLPAGRQHNLTTELLASERMGQIADEIANRYPDRLVIFDSPPVLASSAASVLALYMGQTIFVIEAERTTEPQIKESLSMISSCEHINLLLNKTRFSGSNKKFATYYGYGGR